MVFHQESGYRAFAKESGRHLQGVIVVPKDSSITDIKQLQGLTVAFPSPSSFSATVLPLASLQRKHISVNPQYVSYHDSVYLTVAKGIYPAGGGITRTLNNVADNTKNSLRILWKTEQFTPHAFAAKPGIDSKALQKISEIMFDMSKNPEGKNALASLDFYGIEKAQDNDWDDVRALKIDQIELLLKEKK